jgi:aminoglycoside/choline kinase family phosphotransferase
LRDSSRNKGIASKEVIPLTPDASTRKYYRIGWKKRPQSPLSTPSRSTPEFHPYLDVTRCFSTVTIPVPEIYEVDGNAGIIVQEIWVTANSFRSTKTNPKSSATSIRKRQSR